MHTGESGDAQDMFRMGGLARKMPVTFVTFLIGGLALAGFPLITAGFWSKDAILSATFGNFSMVIFWMLVLAAFLNGFLYHAPDHAYFSGSSPHKKCRDMPRKVPGR